MVEIKSKKVRNDLQIKLEDVFLIQTNFCVYIQTEETDGSWVIFSNHADIAKEIDHINVESEEMETVEDFYNTIMVEKEEIIKVVTEREKFNIIIEIE